MEWGGQGVCRNNGRKLARPRVAIISVYILAPSSKLARWQKMEDKEQEVGFQAYCLEILGDASVELID